MVVDGKIPYHITCQKESKEIHSMIVFYSADTNT